MVTWRRDKLPELVRAMAGRPRHEALRGHVTELLREGFGAPYDEIAHEVYLLDNSGRIDTLWGATDRADRPAKPVAFRRISR